MSRNRSFSVAVVVFVTMFAIATNGIVADKVVVYSPHGEDILIDIAEQFEQETG